MGTPRRRLLVSELRNNFSMPLASSTPKKHEDDESSNNEEDPITIIEVPRRNYRREIRLLRLRLDEIKLKIHQEAHRYRLEEDKENLHVKQESFFLGIQKDLLESCNNLVTQCQTQDLWAREQQKEVEQVYKTHLDEMGRELIELREENGKLRQKFVLIDSKISEVLNENKYLRWENEQFSQNISILQRQLNEKTLAVHELLAELQCMKSNQTEINRLHSLKIQSVVQEARQEEKAKLNKLAQHFENRLKDDNQKQHCQEITGLSSTSSPRPIERLADHNRQLYNKRLETRNQVNEEHVSSPRSFKASDTQLSSTHKSPEKSSVRFGTIERIASDGQIFRQTVTEWEEKFGALKKDYLMEREQRKNVTKLLLEMSKDMKLLLNRQNGSDTTTSVA